MKLRYWLFFLFCLQAKAVVLTENFTTTAKKDTATAIWNFELGYIHPNLKVYSFQPPAQPVSSSIFSVSDGSHASFDVSTYSSFGSVVANHITVDANTFPILKVSRFHLDSAYTLSSINGPLVIHSLSTVRIDGVIQCFGENGQAATGATGGAGGSGRCGGSSGGTGGNSAGSGNAGLPFAGTVTGGGGGIYNGAAPGSGGGGGGAFVGNDGAQGFDSVPATNTGGAAGAGATGANHEFTIINGSPGGGGGSGSDTEGGGGGGGGGGTVIIHAVSGVTISATGAILAYGGNGGGANSGGGGGGGGGGSVKIFTPANLELATGTPVDVTEGNGATPTVANAGDGGNGSFGRTWIISGTFSGSGSESHGSLLLSTGNIGFNTAVSETIVTTSFDIGSASATYQTLVSNPTNGDIVLEIAGSQDDFVVDDSGWLDSSLVSTLTDKRYLKFRVILTNSNASSPTVVDSFSLNYTTPTAQAATSGTNTIENFDFTSAGCGSVNKPSSGSRLPNLFFVLLLMLIPCASAISLRQIR